MRKIYPIILLMLSVLILSGCINIKRPSPSTDGGIFKSTDFGENWEQKVFVAQEKKGIKTISNVDTHFMVFGPENKNTIYLVTKGNGIYKTDNSGETWQPTKLSSGTYSSFSIDNLNTNVIYAAKGNKIIKTVDGMQTWHTIYIETRPGQKLVSVIVDPFKFGIVYAATTTSLIKSYDYGNSWQLLNWKKIKIRQLYQSRKNTNILYALTDKGIYKSTNGASDWTNISGSLKEYKGGSTIHWFNFDPATEYIFLGTAYGIIKSTDGGSSWHPISTLFDFKKIPIKTVIYNPNNLHEIIFSVKNILHKTDDNGKTWTTLKTVPTSRLIYYMITDPYHEDTIYLGTYKPKQ